MKQHRSGEDRPQPAIRRLAIAAMAVAVALLGTAIDRRESLAGASFKKAAPKDTQLPEVVRLQSAVQHLSAWKRQIDPGHAFERLGKSRGAKRVYHHFETELRGRRIAWVLARKDVDRNVVTRAPFIEHNGGWSPDQEKLETNVRCYVDDEAAKLAKAAAPESMVLCIGKIADVEFFKDFISIGIKAEAVTIGNEAIEAWVGQQAKAMH